MNRSLLITLAVIYCMCFHLLRQIWWRKRDTEICFSYCTDTQIFSCPIIVPYGFCFLVVRSSNQTKLIPPIPNLFKEEHRMMAEVGVSMDNKVYKAKWSACFGQVCNPLAVNLPRQVLLLLITFLQFTWQVYFTCPYMFICMYELFSWYYINLIILM